MEPGTVHEHPPHRQGRPRRATLEDVVTELQALRGEHRRLVRFVEQTRDRDLHGRFLFGQPLDRRD